MRIKLFWRVYTPGMELRVGPVGCFPWRLVYSESPEYRVARFWNWWNKEMALIDTVSRAKACADACFDLEAQLATKAQEARGVYFLQNGYTYDSYQDAVAAITEELRALPRDERCAVTAVSETSWIIYTSAHLAVLTFTENADAWEVDFGTEDLGPCPLQTMAAYAMAADVEDALSRLGEEEE